jgi:hypothetical protein
VNLLVIVLGSISLKLKLFYFYYCFIYELIILEYIIVTYFPCGVLCIPSVWVFMSYCSWLQCGLAGVYVIVGT